jgi:hypothetical protein
MKSVTLPVAGEVQEEIVTKLYDALVAAVELLIKSI